MENATFDEIQKRLTGHIAAQRKSLRDLLTVAKQQYRFSMENYGYNSKQAGQCDQIVCALQAAIRNGNTKKETLQILTEIGYTGSVSNAYEYFQKVEQATDIKFEEHPYVRTKTRVLKDGAGSTGKEYDFITRTGILKQ